MLPVDENIERFHRVSSANLVAGQRVPATAGELHISPHTVRNHLKSIYRQLDVGNQSELIECVRSLGDPKS